MSATKSGAVKNAARNKKRAKRPDYSAKALPCGTLPKPGRPASPEGAVLAGIATETGHSMTQLRAVWRGFRKSVALRELIVRRMGDAGIPTPTL